MKILENKFIAKESLSKIKEGTQFCIGSTLTGDMDYYEADGTDRIEMAIESIVNMLMNKGHFDAETDCITIDISIGDKENIDDEGNIL